jgi:CheY-like chemotaxis protein
MTGHARDVPSGVKSADRHPPSPLEALIADRLGRRVRGLRVEVRAGGLVLRGQAETFYVKQLAQQAATALTAIPVIANRIEVAGADGESTRPVGADVRDRTFGDSARSVLLATGDDRLLAAGRDHLAAQGYVVATATGGLGCVTLFREFSPDVVILDTDLHWGGADGVLARLRSGGGPCVPVVLLASPFADFRRGGAYAAPPPTLVLDKPVGVGDLLRAVRTATETEFMSLLG